MQTIPSDAAFVVTFDMKSLSEKGDIPNLIKTNADKLNAMSSGLGEGSLKLWKEIQGNPEASGLSFTDKWVCFGEGETNPILAVLAKVSDIDKWREVIKAMESEGLATPISVENDVEITILGQNVKCFFDQERVLWIWGQAASGIMENKTILGWFAQTGEDCLLSNKEFSAFLKEQKDVNYWLHVISMPTSFKALYSSYLPEGVLLGSLYSVGYCDFQKGKISIVSEVRSDDKDSMDKLKNIFEMTGKQSGKFVKQIPANALYTIGANLDGEKLYKFISSLPGLSLSQDEAIQSEDTKKVIQSIDGDVLLSVSGLSGNSVGFMGVTVPDMALFAQVNDDYVVELFKRNLSLLGVKEIGDNRYKLSMGESSIYFGMKDKKSFFVTNSKSIFDNLSGGIPDSMAKTPYASVFDKSPYGIVINLKEGITAVMPLIVDYNSVKGPYLSMLNQCPFTYLTISGNGMNSTAEIFFSDGDKNAFTSFIDWIMSCTSQVM